VHVEVDGDRARGAGLGDRRAEQPPPEAPALPLVADHYAGVHDAVLNDPHGVADDRIAVRRDPGSPLRPAPDHEPDERGRGLADPGEETAEGAGQRQRTDHRGHAVHVVGSSAPDPDEGLGLFHRFSLMEAT
jgi:hypothetical protein